MTIHSLPARTDAPARTEPDKPARRGGRRLLRERAGRTHHAGPLAYVLLAVMAILSIFPLYWTMVAASTDNTRVSQTPPPFLPGPNLFSNLARAWDEAAMGKAMINSTIVAGVIALSTVFFATLAGFAFAKLRFKGRNGLMLMVVATMAIPTQLGIIPLFMVMRTLGWTGEIGAVVVPTLVTAFGVFFMRQYLVDVIPDELIESARMDGASMISTFWHVALPAARPAMAILGLFTFMTAWTDFLWPLLVLDAGNPTLQTALSQLQSARYVDYSVVLAGAVLATLPLLVLFALAGKQLISGIMQGAVKG